MRTGGSTLMPRYFGALTIAVMLGMVFTRVFLLKRRGIKAMKFGELDKRDFLIPPFALFYIYLIFRRRIRLAGRQHTRVFSFYCCILGGSVFVCSGAADVVVEPNFVWAELPGWH